MARRYRRKSAASSIISDTAFITSRLGSTGSLIFTIITFTLFYWLIPWWLESNFQQLNVASPAHAAFVTIFMRRIHWFQYVGIVCGIIGLIFTVRNLFTDRVAGYQERKQASTLAKLLARFFE